MMNYKQFYDKISGPLRPYAKVLGGLNKAITRTFYLLFPIFLILVRNRRMTQTMPGGNPASKHFQKTSGTFADKTPK
jgi:hypothetical protein